MNEKDWQTIQILKGQLIDYFRCKHKAEIKQMDAAQIRSSLGSAKAIRYDKEPGSGSSNNDEKLASMIQRISDIEAERDGYLKKAARISKKYNLEYELSERQKQITKMILADGMTYRECGKTLGYSESGIRKIFNEILNQLVIYLDEDYGHDPEESK